MKRFHVNVSVADIAEGVRFYSALFGADPVVIKDYYARWMLDEPRLNFAISRRGFRIGVNHLGFQVESAAELAAMRAQLAAADQTLTTQIGASCCYALSDKYWIRDPGGTAWEAFHTLATIPVYGADAAADRMSEGCCAPPAATSATSSCKPDPAGVRACCES